jgi:hypothetical protein
MGWEAWVTLAIVVLVLWSLARALAGADVILMSRAALLVSLGNPVTTVSGDPRPETFLADVADARQYTVEMQVLPGSQVDGLTTARAGLRHLPDAYLSAIERDGDTLVAVGPDQRVRAGAPVVYPF